MDCPAPNFWPRSRCSRSTVESSFCAATVPSQDSGGVRQVSQLPQAAAPVWPKYASSWPRRHSTVSQSASMASRCASQVAPVREVALGRLDHLALLHDVLQPVRQPGRRRQAVAPGPAGLLVVALDRLRQVEVGDEPHVGLVDAHPERDRRDHDQAVLAQEAGLVGRAGPLSRARRGTAAPRCRSAPGTRPSSPPRRGTGSRRCPRRRGARCAAGRAAAGGARSWRRCGTGCWGGRSWR